MAQPAFSYLSTPSLKLYFPLLPFPNPSPNALFSSPLRSSRQGNPPFSSNFGRCPRPPPPAPSPVRCASGHGRYGYEHEPVVHPRPREIPWSKDLANSVHLIGTVGLPVQIKHLGSGKVLAWTRLAVNKSATETTWISLTFWDDLAHVAFQHVEKGQRVHVSGRLVSDVIDGRDEKPQVYYKVVVQQLDFVERFSPTLSLNEPEAYTVASGTKLGSYVGYSSGSTEELWQAFFANPMDWWDNRRNKKNDKYPDFKHKHTREALWIDGKNNPHWVKSQLAILDSRMGSLQTNGTSSSVSLMNIDDLPF